MDSTRNPGRRTGSSVSSCEYLRIRAFDQRIVTRISVGTQADWRHEDECRQDNEYPNQTAHKHPEDCLQRQSHTESVSQNMKSELKISPDNKVLDLLSEETPRTLAACQGEAEEPLTNLDKCFQIPTSSGSDSEETMQTVLNIRCERCQRLKKPPVTSDQIANSVDPKESCCREKTLKLSEMWLKGEAVIAEETVTDRDPATQKDQRLKGLEFKRSSDRQAPKAGHQQQVATNLHDRPSDDAWTAETGVSIPHIEIVDSENAFSLNGKRRGQKRMTPLVKHYNNGETFIVIFPDGTGQVCYPSGRLAILVSAAPSADWSCVVVLEDKHPSPHIQAVFTTGGRGTCYHSNGCIWVNLTPWGGTCCSDKGDLRKHWSWLNNKDHNHAPPCRPLCLTLSPNLTIRIQSQEHICIAFTSGKHSIQLNVGAKLKPNQGKGLPLPGPDMLERHLQQKSAEINVLLANFQSLITYLRKVKPQQSLISQMERQQLPMKQQQSAKKTP